MKLIISLVILSMVCFSCKEKPANPVEQYGTTMMQSYEKGKQAADVSNLQVLKSAVMSYQAAEGKNPQSLEELRNVLPAGIDISQFAYDSRTGSVSLKN